MFEKPCVTIIIVVAIVLLIFYWYSKSQQKKINIRFEPFITDPSPELEINSRPGSFGEEGLLIDQLRCDKRCCGDATYDAYNDLTAAELQRKVAENVVTDNGPYIRTNYTCGNGPDGVGCPCVTKPAYFNLVNRGLPYNPALQHVDPTFFVGGDIDNQPYEVPRRLLSQDGKSMFVPEPKLNDLQVQREPIDISPVRRTPQSNY